MSISREAQIGQSMIFAFPPWFRDNLMALLQDGSGFHKYLGLLEFSSSTWTKVFEHKGKTAWIHSDFAGSDGLAILKASWCYLDSTIDPNIKYSGCSLEKAPHYWKSDWVMPHLASLDGKPSPDIILNFSYDQHDHVYSLNGVCVLTSENDKISVTEVSPLALMVQWQKEFLCERETVRAGSEEFLEALKLLLRSTDIKTERLRRYANALLQWYYAPEERGANPKS